MSLFSARLPLLSPNRLGLALEALRRRGVALLDLTETNPTRVGLAYPEALLAPLALPAGLVYEPHPQGLRVARDAVSADLRRLGLEIDPARLVLTASTSEAYGFLFKLLCDPGDEVLVPAPSYPLFEHLTRFEGIVAVPYPLDPHGGWSIEPDAIGRLVGPRTRAVLVVSPNNPTGAMLQRAELDALAAICRAADLALIGDEVFAEYRFPVQDTPAGHGLVPFVSVLHQRTCLACALGGLSKSIGTPQLKLAWIAVGGPDAVVAGAVERLTLIADTYLSVSTPVQRALPALLDEGRLVRAQIQERVTDNLAALRRALERAPACTLVSPHGGWSAVVRVPAGEPEEARVLDLLERHHVLVSPGYFYDFPYEAFLVLSLLVQPEVLTAGLERIVEALGEPGTSTSAGIAPNLS